jgi:uncharacterized integral membrane protein
MMDIDVTEPAVASKSEIKATNEHSKVGTVWMFLVIFVLLLLLLAIFILQNSTRVKISYFGFHGDLSFGVGMLLAALAGAVLTLLIGSIRILQLKSFKKKAIA